MLKLNLELTSCSECKAPFEVELTSDRAPITSSCCGSSVCKRCILNAYENEKKKNGHARKTFPCGSCGKKQAFHIDKLPASNKEFLEIIPLYQMIVDEADKFDQELIQKEETIANVKDAVKEALAAQSILDLECRERAVSLALEEQDKEEEKLLNEAIALALKKQKQINQDTRVNAINEAVAALSPSEVKAMMDAAKAQSLTGGRRSSRKSKNNVENLSEAINDKNKSPKRGLQTISSDHQLETEKVQPQSQTKNVQPEYETENVQPQSQTENVQLEYETENVQPQYQTENVQPEYETENVQPEYQTENVQPEYQTENVQPECQTEQLAVVSQFQSGGSDDIPDQGVQQSVTIPFGSKARVHGLINSSERNGSLVRIQQPHDERQDMYRCFFFDRKDSGYIALKNLKVIEPNFEDRLPASPTTNTTTTTTSSFLPSLPSIPSSSLTPSTVQDELEKQGEEKSVEGKDVEDDPEGDNDDDDSDEDGENDGDDDGEDDDDDEEDESSDSDEDDSFVPSGSEDSDTDVMIEDESDNEETVPIGITTTRNRSAGKHHDSIDQIQGEGLNDKNDEEVEGYEDESEGIDRESATNNGKVHNEIEEVEEADSDSMVSNKKKKRKMCLAESEEDSEASDSEAGSPL